jgi:acyl carrier protein
VTRLECEIRQFLADYCLLSAHATAVASDVSLTGSGFIDSSGILELILFLESTYGIDIPDAETVPENLDTVSNIVRYVQAKLPQAEETHRDVRQESIA